MPAVLRLALVALALALALLTVAPRVGGQTAADSAAIRQAALDYIEGYYEGDAGRMARAVHPELVKRIVNRDRRLSHEAISSMGASQLIEGTRAGFGKETPVDRRRKDVAILDIAYGRVAAVKVVAATWIDYMHLARVDGQWRIVNVLWEVPPS